MDACACLLLVGVGALCLRALSPRLFLMLSSSNSCDPMTAVMLTSHRFLLLCRLPRNRTLSSAFALSGLAGSGCATSRTSPPLKMCGRRIATRSTSMAGARHARVIQALSLVKMSYILSLRGIAIWYAGVWARVPVSAFVPCVDSSLFWWRSLTLRGLCKHVMRVTVASSRQRETFYRMCSARH